VIDIAGEPPPPFVAFGLDPGDDDLPCAD